MVKPSDRRLKKKFTRLSSSTREERFKEKGKRKVCAITGKKLSGTAAGRKGKINKFSKTQKRPSVPFGGILGANAREKVTIEMAKVINGEKLIEDVSQKYRKYVVQMMKRAE